MLDVFAITLELLCVFIEETSSTVKLDKKTNYPNHQTVEIKVFLTTFAL